MHFGDFRGRVERVAMGGFEAGRVVGAKVWEATDGAEKVGVLGAVAGGTCALSFTSFGGFGVVAGGTGVGVAGLTGATIATGGAALAGFGAGYLIYKIVEQVGESRSGGAAGRPENETDDPEGPSQAVELPAPVRQSA